MNGLIVFTALVAAASANPQLLMNNWGWPNAGIAQPLAYSSIAQPFAYSGLAKPVVYTKTGLTKPVVYTTLAGSPMVYSGLLPKIAEEKMMKKVEIIADDTLKAGTPEYAMKGKYVAESAGIVHKAKRSAEPIWPLAYNTMPLAYNTLPLAYKTPLALKTPLAYNTLPLAYKTPMIYNTMPIMPVMPKMIADDTLKAGTPDYANKGQYIAESAGIVHIAKRSTKEEEEKKKIIFQSAMPLAYNTLPLAYNTLPYSTPMIHSGIPAINAWNAAPAWNTWNTASWNTLPMLG